MENDKPEIVQTGGELNIYYKNTYFYPTLSPLKSAERKVELLKLSPNTLIFVPSLGLGYGLKKLLDKIPPNSHILCIEISEKLFKLGISQKLPIESPHITIIRTASEDILNDVLGKIGIHNFRRVVTINLNRGYLLYKEKYDYLIDTCRRIINNYWQNRITTIKMGGLWIRNMLSNLQFFPSAYDLRHIQLSSPVIIIGAGVSLEENIPFIKKNKGHATLVAVDTALPVLGNFSIIPDLIVTQDAQLTNLQDFIPSMPIPPSLLITDITTVPSILKLTQTIIVLFKSEFEKLAIFQRMAKHGILPYSIPPLGSVGITAIYLAIKITKKNFPIFTVGLDFCYKKNRTHARGSTLHGILNFQSLKLKPIETLNFEHIITRPIIKPANITDDSFTDLVLYNYKFQFNKLLNENSRIYIVDQNYSWNDEIAKQTLDANTANSIISSYPHQTTITKPLKQTFKSEKIENFLKKESNILKDTIKLITRYLNTSTPGTTAVKEQLKLIDYTFFFFPDYYGEPSPGKSFLKRIIISASYYRERIEKILKNLHTT